MHGPYSYKIRACQAVSLIYIFKRKGKAAFDDGWGEKFHLQVRKHVVSGHVSKREASGEEKFRSLDDIRVLGSVILGQLGIISKVGHLPQ